VPLAAVLNIIALVDDARRTIATFDGALGVFFVPGATATIADDTAWRNVRAMMSASDTDTAGAVVPETIPNPEKDARRAAAQKNPLMALKK
jgi:hypothetical protein